MSVELQLRALAEAVTAEQRPVTAVEAMSRAARHANVDEPPRRSGLLLVAASTVLVGGGLIALLASDRRPNDEPVPGGSIPATVAPATSFPASVTPETTVPATVPVSPTVPVPRGQSSEGFVNEPTLGYRDGVEWWVPDVVPVGWQYGYAAEDGDMRVTHLLGPDQTTVDVEFGGDATTIGEVAVDAATETLGEHSWSVTTEGSVGVAARVDGQLLVVGGPIGPVRTIAASLGLRPETDLVRPPFRNDSEPGPVVLTLPADEFGRTEPFELRAHTDGLFTTVGGEIKRVSADDPLAFGDYVYDITGDDNSYPVVVTGVAFDGVEEVNVGNLAGMPRDVTTIESDRFTERFFAFVTEVPTAVLERHERGGPERLTRWVTATVDGQKTSYGIEPSDAALQFEPTTAFDDDQEWLVPVDVPDGFEFESARRYQSGSNWVGQEITYTDPDQPPMEAQPLRISTYVTVDGSAVTTSDASENPLATPVEIGGQTWFLEEVDAAVGPVAILTGVLDGRLAEIVGLRTTAVAVAEQLRLIPEPELPRPPLDSWSTSDASTSLVVATLSGADSSADVSEFCSELRVATDGVTISIADGSPEPVLPDEPVVFLNSSCSGQSDDGPLLISGYTRADVATLEFEQPGAESVIVEPEDLSGHFGLGFFVVALESWSNENAIPDPDGGFTYEALYVIARDANEHVLAVAFAPY